MYKKIILPIKILSVNDFLVIHKEIVFKINRTKEYKKNLESLGQKVIRPTIMLESFK